jgi:hypothetical protein
MHVHIVRFETEAGLARSCARRRWDRCDGDDRGRDLRARSGELARAGGCPIALSGPVFGGDWGERAAETRIAARESWAPLLTGMGERG